MQDGALISHERPHTHKPNPFSPSLPLPLFLPLSLPPPSPPPPLPPSLSPSLCHRSLRTGCGDVRAGRFLAPDNLYSDSSAGLHAFKVQDLRLKGSGLNKITIQASEIQGLVATRFRLSSLGLRF